MVIQGLVDNNIYNCLLYTSLLEQRNHIAVGDQLEIICPDGKNIPLTAVKIFDEDGVPLSAARHPRQLIQIPNPGLPGLKPPLIVRRPVK